MSLENTQQLIMESVSSSQPEMSEEITQQLVIESQSQSSPQPEQLQEIDEVGLGLPSFSSTPTETRAQEDVEQEERERKLQFEAKRLKDFFEYIAAGMQPARILDERLI